MSDLNSPSYQDKQWVYKALIFWNTPNEVQPDLE
jgi:hypothetical protein